MVSQRHPGKTLSGGDPPGDLGPTRQGIDAREWEAEPDVPWWPLDSLNPIEPEHV